MGKITMLLMCAFAAVAMTGCSRTYSAKPFYTGKNKIDVPAQLVGQWYAEPQGSLDEAVNLQIDRDGTVLVRETRKVDGREQVQTAKLAVQFFRVGDGVYVDAILKEMPDSRLEKSIAALMLFPVHALAKVEFHGDTLQLRYPSPDLGKALKDKKLPPVMTFTTFDEEIEDEDGVAVFTATGEAWEDVLQNLPATVFGDSDKEVVTFKRVVVK